MKVRDTSPGRLYALSSKTGCTAVNGTMVVAVPSKGQVVVLALDKKIIINGDDNAKFVEVRWGANAAIGSRPTPSWFSDVLSGIISIVGEDTFDINYIPADNKLFLQFSLDVTNEQIAEVNSFLERVVLPKDLVVEMEWVDGLPTSYKRLEYLESTGTQYIKTDVRIKDVCAEIHYELIKGSCPTSFYNTENSAGIQLSTIYRASDNYSWYESSFNIDGAAVNCTHWNAHLGAIAKIKVDLPNLQLEAGDIIVKLSSNYYPNDNNRLILFAHHVGGNDTVYGIIQRLGQGRIKVAVFSNAGVPTANFIPVLDQTGAPCMFDLVSRKPFYNSGTGDFTYPGKEIEVATYSLRNRMYGKITEHGIRRLYRVPEGYSSKEEYAAENGFKLLIETPMPEEGNWTPVWHDREDCIELEWVETEHPAEVEHPTEEEELQIEDTENA